MQNTLTTVDIHNIFTQHFLQDINLDVETYMDVSKISKRGPNVILHWNPQDVFINACKYDILSLWGGNVDLQYIINEITTVKYICSYMTKGEKGMGETLKRVAKECQNDAIWTQMNKIKKEFLGKWVLGEPESAMQVLSVWLMKKSTKVVPVTSMKYECVSLLKPQSQLAQLHGDDEEVFATSLITRYAARPVSLQNMYLVTFAVRYDVIQFATKKEETHGGNDEEKEMHNTENDNSVTRIKLQKGLGVIRKRKQEAILCTGRYKIHAEPEKYYHAKLLLYYPWNNEDDIIS